VFESIRNHKPQRQKSPADEFEALARSITAATVPNMTPGGQKVTSKPPTKSGGKSRFYHRKSPEWRDWCSRGRRLKNSDQ
jgi:hypothetical protein